MKKNTITRIFAIFFFTIGMLALLFYIFEKYISTSSSILKSEKAGIEQAHDTNKIQYRFSYKGNGNLKQIIHLNKGEAFFTSTHKGENNYSVALKTANDSLIKIIFNTKGNFKGYDIVNVPENNAYILDIRTDGEWEIDFK